MKRKRGVFLPRTIDRAMFGILATLHVANGIYLTGPWYLDETDVGKASLFNLFDNPIAVALYGVLLLIDGFALIYATAGKGVNYTAILSAALLYGFLIRLYALIGVFITLESWRPPSYLSHVATVFMLGAYWIWVRICARPV